MTRVAVTGATGYIGQELANVLASWPRIETVLRIDRVFDQSHPDMLQVDLSNGSVEDVSSALEGVDTVFHLAAARTDWGLSSTEYFRDNVEATRTIIEAVQRAGVRRLVHFSTVGVYGPSATAKRETENFEPVTDYGITKAKAEEELTEAAAKYGWSLRVLRPSAVFSEYQPSNTNIYRLIEAIRKHKFVMVGDGSEIKTTSYLRNVVDAALWLYQDLQSGGIRVFNYVDEPKLSTKDLVSLISAELGRLWRPPRIPLPVVLGPARILDRVAEVTRRDLPITSARIRKFCTPTDFDSSLIRSSGFKPHYDSLTALRRTVAWHRGAEPDTQPDLGI